MNVLRERCFVLRARSVQTRWAVISVSARRDTNCMRARIGMDVPTRTNAPKRPTTAATSPFAPTLWAASNAPVK